MGRVVGFVIFALFPPLSVVAVDVTVLTHSIGVQLRVRTVPRLLCTAMFVVAVAAHSLRVVLPLSVTATVRFLSA